MHPHIYGNKHNAQLQWTTRRKKEKERKNIGIRVSDVLSSTCYQGKVWILCVWIVHKLLRKHFHEWADYRQMAVLDFHKIKRLSTHISHS